MFDRVNQNLEKNKTISEDEVQFCLVEAKVIHRLLYPMLVLELYIAN